MDNKNLHWTYTKLKCDREISAKLTAWSWWKWDTLVLHWGWRCSLIRLVRVENGCRRWRRRGYWLRINAWWRWVGRRPHGIHGHRCWWRWHVVALRGDRIHLRYSLSRNHRGGHRWQLREGWCLRHRGWLHHRSGHQWHYWWNRVKGLCTLSNFSFLHLMNKIWHLLELERRILAKNYIKSWLGHRECWIQVFLCLIWQKRFLVRHCWWISAPDGDAVKVAKGNSTTKTKTRKIINFILFLYYSVWHPYLPWPPQLELGMSVSCRHESDSLL